MSNRLGYRAAWVVAAMVGVHAARGEDAWQLVTDDFAQQPVTTVKAISDQGATVETRGAAAERVVSFDHLLELRRDSVVGSARSPERTFAVSLSAAPPLVGETFVGAPVRLDGGTVEWNEPILGTLKLPLKRFASLTRVRGGEALAAGAGSSTEDVISLTNGDVLRGIVADIGAASVSIQSAAGAVTNAPLDTIGAVRFASVGTASAGEGPPARVFRITLEDGTVLSATHIGMAAGTSAMTLGGAEAGAVAMSAVVAIEQLDGPVVWLSSLVPTRAEQSPWLGMSLPARADASVVGGPLRFGDRTFAHGWGVHARSVLVFAIDPSYRRFRTAYAIDGAENYADLTVRIRVDGQVVHERTHFRAGELAPVVTVDVEGHKELTLEVDYGDTGDVQGRLNWIESAFLRTGDR